MPISRFSLREKRKRYNAWAHSSFRSPFLSSDGYKCIYPLRQAWSFGKIDFVQGRCRFLDAPKGGGGAVGGRCSWADMESSWFHFVRFFFFYSFLFFSTFYTFGCYYTIFALGVAYCVLGAFAENYPVSSIELVFSTRTDSRWNETNTTNTDHTRLLYANVISFYSYVERELVLGCFSSRWSWTQSMHSYCVSRAAGTHQRRGGGRAAGEQSCTVPPDKETR